MDCYLAGLAQPYLTTCNEMQLSLAGELETSVPYSWSCLPGSEPEVRKETRHSVVGMESLLPSFGISFFVAGKSSFFTFRACQIF